jgi:hypothetical protein
MYEDSMRRSVAVLSVALLAACVPTTTSTPSYTESIFPAISTSRPTNSQDWKLDRCGYTVTFSGKPVDFTNDVPQVNLSYDYSLKYAEAEYEEVAECGCPKKATAIPSNITKSQSNYFLSQFMKERDYKLIKAAYLEKSPQGKIAEFEAQSPSMLGELVARGRIYYGSECITSLMVTMLRTDVEVPRAFAFMNSPRKPSPLTSSPPTAPSVDASSRLKALKDLLDQKLVTPAEYDAKRRAIIDGM